LVVVELVAQERVFQVALEAVASTAVVPPFSPLHPLEALAMLAQLPVVVVPDLRLLVIRLVSDTPALLSVPLFLVLVVRVVVQKLLPQTLTPAMAVRLVLAMWLTPVLLAWLSSATSINNGTLFQVWRSRLGHC
jgi:hypothetical protein